ncbi:PfkB family carbohydrate kinase [Desulfurispira natronophila]|uniref:Fructokinase n=1 Tax=Desulfurispira natronophila TaxID=682562 RepID=A0A7W8DGM6_9BACT|nr:PfkB family carbohydrate kinase [Desulfurispira natronophila]MBB5021570.1 fructokinase [Desulfurispira natronophila]
MGHMYVFGEVLFDHFPDGESVLGGAPFNVAWHLQGLGQSPLLVSRVGNDSDGEAVCNAMESHGMDTSALATHGELPTGSVKVSLKDGSPSYTIATPAAWDAIDPPQLSIDSSNSFLYHGTLALRNDYSRSSLESLYRTMKPRSFVDINLRSPHYGAETLEFCLRHAHWLKLNDSELLELESQVGGNDTSALFSAGQLFAHRQLEGVILTCGERGAHIFVRSGQHFFQPAVAPSSLVDTVGAGDAFSAVAMIGLQQGWSCQRILQRATAFAARICQQQGATPSPDTTLYHQTQQQWQQEGEQ